VAGAGLLLKGLGLRYAVASAAIRVVSGVESVEAHGTDRVQSVRYLANGVWSEFPAGGLLLHEGVIPNVHMAMSCDVPHEWDARQLCYRARRDAYGRSTAERIAVAGDCGAIHGADAAALQGRLAALGAARAMAASQRPISPVTPHRS
jgi:hypothetical protein